MYLGCGMFLLLNLVGFLISPKPKWSVEEHKTLSEGTHVESCSLMLKEATSLILLFSNFTNTLDESPRQLTQAKYAAIQSQTVCRCKKVETLWHSQKTRVHLVRRFELDGEGIR